jgi:hypothetical protein
MKDNHETKNANNKVGILYNYWLGIIDEVRAILLRHATISS